MEIDSRKMSGMVKNWSSSGARSMGLKVRKNRNFVRQKLEESKNNRGKVVGFFWYLRLKEKKWLGSDSGVKV